MHDRSNLSAKIVLVGDAGAGKTSLVTNLISGYFLSDVSATIGSSFYTRHFEFRDRAGIDTSIWDTAGAERYQSTLPNYIRNAGSVILTTSITDPNCFKSVRTWLSLIHDVCGLDTPVLLAVNKMDLGETGELTRDEMQEQFEGHVQTLFFVSAKTGENVESLFKDAAIRAADYMFESQKSDQVAVDLVATTDETGCC